MILIISLFILSVSIYGQCEDGEFSTVGILDSISVEIFNDFFFSSLFLVNASKCRTSCLGIIRGDAKAAKHGDAMA